MKILWIDDDPHRTKELKELLELLCFEVDFYSNYVEGFNKIKTNTTNIDLVMLDVMMTRRELFSDKETDDGRLTGLLLYKKIREFYSGAILIYTVLRDDSLIQKYIRNDYNVIYLTKPATEDEIISKIREMTK